MVNTRFSAGEAAFRRLTSTVVLLLASGGLAGCSQEAECSRGSSTVEESMQKFLVAVQSGDRLGAESQLVYGFELSDQEVEQLRDGLTGVDVGSLIIGVTSTAPTRFQLSPTMLDGRLIGHYEVGEMIDQSPGCFGVVAGHPAVAGSEASATPTAATATRRP